jgi:hypothetical protein
MMYASCTRLLPANLYSGTRVTCQFSHLHGGEATGMRATPRLELPLQQSRRLGSVLG